MFGKFRIPRPGAAMVIAVIALVFALAGGAVAAKKLSLGALSYNAKNKTVGVGKLIYVQNTQSVNTNPPPVQQNGRTITALCPQGTTVLGGGAKTATPRVDEQLQRVPELPGCYGLDRGRVRRWTAGGASDGDRDLRPLAGGRRLAPGS